MFRTQLVLVLLVLAVGSFANAEIDAESLQARYDTRTLSGRQHRSLKHHYETTVPRSTLPTSLNNIFPVCT